MPSLEALNRSVSGILIAREDDAYAAARDNLLWNAPEPERFPNAIVGATSVKDVQAAVRFAHRHGLKVTARGGGHHGAGGALPEGIVIDLSALNRVKIDPVALVAETGPVVTNRDLTRALSEHALALSACAQVESVDVVMADGELIRASESVNPEVFRVARGAGPAFPGIVVGYRLRLQRLPRAITASTSTYDLTNIASIARKRSQLACMPRAPRRDLTACLTKPNP